MKGSTMASINKKKTAPTVTTFEGAVVKKNNDSEEILRRTVMTCMLWEKAFYESGKSISDRIKRLIPEVKPERVAEIALEARSMMKLRHAPLFIAREMARIETHKHLVARLLEEIIQRPDEMSELLAIYWADGKNQPISSQIKRGLAKAFTKFNEYSLAKYKKDDKDISIRDVLFLSHARPKTGVKGFDKKARKNGVMTPSDEGSQLFKRVVDQTMSTPDTWEVEISKAGNNAESWTRLLNEKKLGGLALLRNLRNCITAKVAMELLRGAIKSMKTERILPFRFIAAARYAPDLEPELEEAMYKCIEDKQKLKGLTALLVDISGSMKEKLSSKSDMIRTDAAYGLAILARELCENIQVYSFSNNLVKIAPRRGFALRDAINNSQIHSGTSLGKALQDLNSTVKYDRLIIITDEQSQDSIPKAVVSKSYIINIASCENGVGYGDYNHINGWSEAVLDFIRVYEEGFNAESRD